MPFLDRLKMGLIIAEHTMPPWLLQSLNLARTVVAVGRNRSLSIYRLDLSSDQGEAVIGYVGPGHDLNFIASLARKRSAELQARGEVSLFKVEAAVEAMRSEYDLVIAELPRKLLARLPATDRFVTDQWLNWYLDTQRPWAEVEKGFHKDALENIRKMDGLERRQTHDQAGFDHFYHHLYRPYIKHRFGPLAHSPSYDMMHHCFQRGWLDLYQKEEALLGGGISYIAAGILHNHVLGFKKGLSSKERTQVSTARYYYSIQTAVASNCAVLNLAQTRPILDNGIARYKRKWGAYVLPDPSQNWGFWIGLGRDPVRANNFLSQHAWIWLDEAHKPHGLIVKNNAAPLTQTQVHKICNRLWNPGLQSIILSARGGFDPKISLSAAPLPGPGPAIEWRPEP